VPAAGGTAERIIGGDGDRVRAFEIGPGKDAERALRDATLTVELVHPHVVKV